MDNVPKFKTIYDTWIIATDVEDPDDLKDPGDYYEWLSSLSIEDKMQLGLATQDDIDDYEEEMEDQDDDDNDDDDFFF